jgi:multimeric flavodoxin WrbA
MTQILAIYGSPRRGGNTDRLLDAFLDGAEETHSVCRRVYASDREIAACNGCQACEVDGHCVIEDDMQQVYGWIGEADLVVLASPVYFYGLTAQAKALIDRSQSLWACKYRLGIRAQKPRAGFLISAGGSKGRRLFECAELTMKYFCDAIDARFLGSLTFASVDRWEDIDRHPEYLDEARGSGQRITAQLASADETSQPSHGGGENR